MSQVGNDIVEEGEFPVIVAMSADGKRAIIASVFDGDETDYCSRRARIYKEVDGSWVQVGGDLDCETKGNDVGNSVVMSADGMRVVV